MEQNEFKINPKYRNRPMAYLRAAKTILYNEVRIQRQKIPKISLNEPSDHSAPSHFAEFASSPSAEF